MKTLRFLWLFLPVILSWHCAEEKADEKSPPNILLIISDDQGWTDYGFMGHPHIETPRIDQLAAESLTFTRGYVAAPLCRPSLATMITGLYPHQHGITGNDPAFEFEERRYRTKWLQARYPLQKAFSGNMYEHPLLTQLLGEEGYLSLQTGKWWEGSWEDGYFTHGMTHGDPARGGRHGDEGLKIGREGLQPVYDLIDTAQTAQKPFFVWYAPFMPHSPHTPPKELEEKYLDKAPTPAVARYWAMCDWFDQTCGELLDHLDREGLSENTLVVYVCDNGWIQEPDRPNRYAPGSKQTPYEMGIRTPIMYRWPGTIAPRMDTTTLASSIDLVPTILAAVGLTPPADLLGLNALDEETLARRTYIFAEDYEHDVPDIERPTQGLEHRVALSYPWKLIVPHTPNVPEGELELYNLAEDPHEKRNLASEYPDRAAQMQEVLSAWWSPVSEE